MTDRELLEHAASSAGYRVKRGTQDGGLVVWIDDAAITWNPLADDGDAFRLAVVLGLVVDCSRPSAGAPFSPHAVWRDEIMSTADLTRRAIVLAAASIGNVPNWRLQDVMPAQR